MATGDDMITAVIIVLSLNLIMFFVGYGLEDLGADNPFNYEDNALREFNTGNSTHFDISSDPANDLPGGAATSISPDTGLSFTDIFTSIKSWLVDATGLGWVLSILSGPKIILAAMGVPLALAWAITALWYGVTLILIVAFIWGR